MAQNLFLNADEAGQQIRDKREADKAQQQTAQQAAEEAAKASKQHEKNKEEGMI